MRIGGTGVKAYRIYLVGRSGRLRLGEAFQALDDAEAIPRMQILTPSGGPAELWESGRLVGSLGEDGEFSSRR